MKQNDLSFGVVSNGDDLTERFTGFTARYDSAPFADIAGSDRMRLGLTFEDYHVEWNQATLAALQGSGLDLYRSRWNVAPELVFKVATPLTVSFGTSFTTLESESNGLPCISRRTPERSKSVTGVKSKETACSIRSKGGIVSAWPLTLSARRTPTPGT